MSKKKSSKDETKKEREDYPKAHEVQDRSEEVGIQAVVVQEADQMETVDQESDELIWIKDSCNIEVNTTDTQAAVSLQLGLQLAIALVIRITIGDTDRSKEIQQSLLQNIETYQKNKQKITIYNSKDVTITTTDTDAAVNIQALLQVLVALVAKIDVL